MKTHEVVIYLLVVARVAIIDRTQTYHYMTLQYYTKLVLGACNEFCKDSLQGLV